MDGISDKASDAQGKTKDDGRLRTASLDIDDTGLLAKVLPAAAQMQGSTPEAMIAMATVPLAAFTANQGPGTLKALDAIVSFAQDWKKPNGPIKISIKPAKTASLQDLDKIMEPNALTDLFGLTVEYAGTRAARRAAGRARAGVGGAPSSDAKLSGRRGRDVAGRQHARRQVRRRADPRALQQGRLERLPRRRRLEVQGQVDDRRPEGLHQVQGRRQESATASSAPATPSP